MISPFVVLVIAGLPKMRPSAWLLGPAEPAAAVDWGAFVAVLLWNTSGYDTVGALAAEVHDPARRLPKALSVVIVLITLVYLLPVAVGVGLDPAKLATWSDGSFTRAPPRSTSAAGSGCGSRSAARSRPCRAAQHAALLRGALRRVSAAQLGVLPSRFGAERIALY